MKKFFLFLYSLIISTNASSIEHHSNKKIINILKDSKVPINTETSDEGGRTGEGGGGNGGRPKTQK